MNSKKLLVNLLVSLIGLFVLFLCLELVFRLPLVKQKTGGNVPALHQWWNPVLKTELNSLGFRDQEHQPEKPDQTKRIIILGDSIVYGQMVALESIFPELLEDQLNQKSDTKVEVINMGLCGWNTVMQLESLVENGLKFQPDLVILTFVLNDPQIKQFPRPEEQFDQEKMIIPITFLDTYLDRHSYFYSFVKFRYNRLLENFNLKADYFTTTRTFYQTETRGYQQFIKALEKINQISQQNNTKFLFVNLNWRPGWDKETKMVLDETQKLSMPVLDMHPYFANYSLSDLQVSPSDWHPNQKAHQIYSQVIGDFILKNHFLTHEDLSRR